MKQQIRINRFYPYSIEEVWAALTDKSALSEWLMPTENFELKVHHEFQFKTKPSVGFDGIVYCKILEIDAPRRIVYHWQGGGMKRPTTVIWNLKSIEDGTLVSLDHFGFEGLSGMMIRYILAFGWRKILRKLLPGYLAGNNNQVIKTLE